MLEGSRAADGVVLLGRAAVHRNAEFQAVGGPFFRPAQLIQPRRLENGAVGQHRGRAILQRPFENGDHIGIEERLATGEVVFLDAQRDRFLQICSTVVRSRKPKR